eukprot:6926459-Pyramimonas_sp.AAC.1
MREDTQTTPERMHLQSGPQKLAEQRRTKIGAVLTDFDGTSTIPNVRCPHQQTHRQHREQRGHEAEFQGRNHI